VELDAAFVKGHSRLATALHALTRFEKAKESYQRVLELDPNDAAAERGVEDCEREIRKQQQAHLEQEERKKKKTARNDRGNIQSTTTTTKR
jgi:tetratricopeptide (TPR) repeat protein